MPGGFPLLGNVCNAVEIAGLTASQSFGTLIKPPTVLNTPGNWLQLTASLTHDITWLSINISDTGNSSTIGNFAIDIGIGSSGNEIVIIPSLVLYLVVSNTFCGNRWMIPIQIPAGTRIAARFQTSSPVATAQCAIQMVGYSGGMTQSQLGGVDVMGFNSATTTGTTLSTTTVNVKGAYSQIIASTAVDYIGLMAAFVLTVTTLTYGAVDVAVGSSGNEVVIIPNIPVRFGSGSSSFAEHGIFQFLPMPIPAGTRLSARLIAGNATQSIGFVIYGVR